MPPVGVIYVLDEIGLPRFHAGIRREKTSEEAGPCVSGRLTGLARRPYNPRLDRTALLAVARLSFETLA
jgi:hypothetical protein